VSLKAVEEQTSPSC